MYVYMYVYAYICMFSLSSHHIFIHIYIYIYICIYIYIEPAGFEHFELLLIPPLLCHEGRDGIHVGIDGIQGIHKYTRTYIHICMHMYVYITGSNACI
jgi:hypothetical protein